MPPVEITDGDGAEKTMLIMLLHGVGADADSMAELGSAIAMEFPYTALHIPDAPFPFNSSWTGRQWFSVRGVTEATPHIGRRLIALIFKS